MSDQLIRLGHSPDPDDAFMFYAIAREKIPLDGFEFEHILRDIQTLNEWADEGRLEVTALSVHAYAYLADKYRLLPHGASMGEQYGPIVVARENMEPDQLRGLRIAVPGLLTSAFLELQLAIGKIDDPVLTPFDKILDVVEAGEVDAGLVIHEGQLTYRQQGLKLVMDLGKWWHELTGGLPLPLGANAVRRDLGEETMVRLSRVLRESIAHGLANREEALAYAAQFGRGLDDPLADRFVGMYVNDRTLEYGDDGRAAVAELFRRCRDAGLIDRDVPVDFIDDE